MKYREEINFIYSREGLYGFTRGYTGMVCRDVPGGTLYFFLFDFFKRKSGIND
jgi:hypothetical protein